jgi:hypothetical protein
LFGTKSKGPEFVSNPYTSETAKSLGSFFTSAAANQFAKAPYTGQLSADYPYTDLAKNLFQGAVGGYNPQLLQDIYGRYADIAQTGFSPQYQAYLDATSKAASNLWRQNVMPSVAERTRGAGGPGSAVPENIAQAGQNYFTQLAGTMAPYALSAAQSEAQNKLAGLSGMAGTQQQMFQQPMTLAQWTQLMNQAFQSGDQAALDRLYQEFQRQQYGLLPYATQFAGSGAGGQVAYPQSVQQGQRAGGLTDLGLVLSGLYPGGIKSLLGNAWSGVKSLGSSLFGSGLAAGGSAGMMDVDPEALMAFLVP